MPEASSGLGPQVLKTLPVLIDKPPLGLSERNSSSRADMLSKAVATIPDTVSASSTKLMSVSDPGFVDTNATTIMAKFVDEKMPPPATAWLQESVGKPARDEAKASEPGLDVSFFSPGMEAAVRSQAQTSKQQMKQKRRGML